MHSLNEYACYLLRKCPVLRRGAAPEGFFQFVRNVGPDKHTFTICHIVDISPVLGSITVNLAADVMKRTCKPNLVAAQGGRQSFIWAERYRFGSSDLPENAVPVSRNIRRAAGQHLPI